MTRKLSLIAGTADGRPVCIPNAQGKLTTPSIVAFPPGGGPPLVGEAARRRAPLDPANTFFSVKRVIGRDFDDVAKQVRGSLAKS